MIGLTDFLLARIAEDEEMWQLAARAELAFTTRSEGIAAVPPVKFAERMLAECDSKRQIVEWHDERDDCCEERYGQIVLDTEPEVIMRIGVLGNHTVSQAIGHQPFLGCVTLMHMALPYASHDDYRDEWRP